MATIFNNNCNIQLQKKPMQNQKKPIQQKKPMQNFTAEKWADKIALFIDNFGFLSGFFWHWTIALPSPTSHLAMLHSKIILSDPNRRVKVVLIGFSLFWSRCRTWGSFLVPICKHCLLGTPFSLSWVQNKFKRRWSLPLPSIRDSFSLLLRLFPLSRRKRWTF